MLFSGLRFIRRSAGDRYIALTVVATIIVVAGGDVILHVDRGPSSRSVTRISQNRYTADTLGEWKGSSCDRSSHHNRQPLAATSKGGNTLRPLPEWHGIVGQKEIVDFLCNQVRGARRLGEPLEPTIFAGWSGSGKTALAKALALELASSREDIDVESIPGFHEIVAGRAVNLLALAEKAEAWEANDLIYLDEAHALPHETQESLYRVIDRSMVPRIERPDNGSKKPRLSGETRCPPVSFVFGTDQPGKLLNALEKRCLDVLTLRPYDDDEMRLIVRKRATELGLLLTGQAHTVLAHACRRTPRVAGRLLKAMRKRYEGEGVSEYTVDHVRRFLREFGTDELGRTPDHRRHMEFLWEASGNRLSLDTLIGLLQHDKRFIQARIEPWLLANGWVERTSSGRQLTEKGRAIMDEAQRGARS